MILTGFIMTRGKTTCKTETKLSCS